MVLWTSEADAGGWCLEPSSSTNAIWVYLAFHCFLAASSFPKLDCTLSPVGSVCSELAPLIRVGFLQGTARGKPQLQGIPTKPLSFQLSVVECSDMLGSYS